MDFASDNTAGIAPAIRDAVMAVNSGYALGYGQDDLTKRVERQLSDLFEREVAMFLVPTGTAANALCLAHLCPPWGAVLCHQESHIVTDECGAPEFFGGGMRLVGLPGVGCKLTPATLRTAISRYSGHRPHQSNAAAVSITQASEAGTIYQVDEVAALAEVARSHGVALHMDGARFGNALARLGVTPAQATWKAGVDTLSFGATKGGAMAAEAVVLFDPARADFMGERRKRAGHLFSKHRFLAAQFQAYLADGYWLKLAAHANQMADRLAHALREAGFPPVWPVEANLVFAKLPREAETRLRQGGAAFYVRNSDSLPDGQMIGPGEMLVRLVTSFSTQAPDVDRFVALLKS